MAIAPPVPSNLTGLDDLAAALYTVTTDSPATWVELTGAEQAHYVTCVGFILDIALPARADNQGPEMERIRADAIGARGVAESGHERRR